MSLIYVRTKPGRIARVAPKGEFIPHDTFVGVRETPYISRLLNVHKDIEKQSKKTPAPAAPVAPSKDAPEAEAKAKG